MQGAEHPFLLQGCEIGCSPQLPQAWSRSIPGGEKNDSPTHHAFASTRFGVATVRLLRPHSPATWKNRLGAGVKVARTLAFCSVQLIAGGFSIFSQVVL
jgi:hypothetical protein